MSKEKSIAPNVKIGDQVLFERNGFNHIGKVFKVQANSVLVEICNESKWILGYETNKTVVNHKHYTEYEKSWKLKALG